MIQNELKQIVLLGKTGAGKSFLGNQLLGVKKNEAFVVGKGNGSGTTECKAVKGYLFGDISNCKIQLMDTPGFFDSRDNIRSENKSKPNSLTSLEAVSKEVTNAMQGSVNRIFLCIAANQKYDELIKNIIELIKMIVSGELRIAVVITMMNNIEEDELEDKKQSWTSSIRSQGFEDIFFLGNKLESDTANKLKIQELINKSIAEPIILYNDLTSNQKKRIKEIFNYVEDCLSMDMLIHINQSDTFHAYNDREFLFNNQYTIAGKDDAVNMNLGFLHYNTSKMTKFVQFHLVNQEDKIILELTIRHLVYVFEKQTFVIASEVEIGNHFIGIDNKLYEVNEICQVMKRGFYTPLTSTGHFYANKVLVSSYAAPFPFFNQEICHLGLKPFILYRQYGMPQSDKPQQKLQIKQEEEQVQEQKQAQEQKQEQEYVAPYIKFLKLIILKK